VGHKLGSAEPNLAPLSHPLHRLINWMVCDASSGGCVGELSRFSYLVGPWIQDLFLGVLESNQH
jgi:hypothetical protein